MSISNSLSADDRRGITCIILGGLVFCISDVLTKLTALSIPASEVVFVRGMATSFSFLVALILRGELSKLWMVRQRPVVGRSTFEMLSTVTFIIALPHVKLAEMSALSQASPALATLLAILIFHERVTIHRWAATIGGMIGVIMILKPDPAGFNAWALLALASAMTVAVRDLFSSRIAAGTPTLATTFLAAIMITTFGFLFGLGVEWPMLEVKQIFALIVAGVCHGLGIFLNVLGFSGKVTISLVSPFRYLVLMWTTLAGFLVFQEVPDAWAISGALLVIASGLYVMHREVRRNRILSATASRDH